MPLAMRSGHLLVPSVQQSPVLVGLTIPERVLEILDELLSNATVHGKPGPVHLEVSQVGPSIDIAIVDHGPGIEPGKGDLLIQPIFQRTPEAWAADGSMGLGLGLARRTADALGARLSLAAHHGGSRAVLSLPVPAEPGA